MNKKPSYLLIEYIILLLIVLPGALFAQQQPKLQGKVNNYKMHMYGTRGNDTLRERWGTVQVFLDRSGREKNTKFYMNANGKDTLYIWEVNHYNKYGKLVKTDSGVGHQPNSGTKTFTYDKKHDLVETAYAERARKPSIVIVYDKKNGVEKWFANGASKPYTIVHHLNKFQDERIEGDFDAELHNSDSVKNDTVAHRSLITYNTKHDILDEIWFKRDGKRASHETYRYDDNGNVLKYVDSNRRYIDGAPMEREKNPNTWSRTYKYSNIDKEGNWLTQQQFIDNKLVLIARREFDYY